MVGEACLPSNAYYPRTPDYTLCSGVHVCWSEHSDSSFVYGFMSLDYGFGTTTATTLHPETDISSHKIDILEPASGSTLIANVPFMGRQANKRQKDCLWKQRTHYRSENGLTIKSALINELSCQNISLLYANIEGADQPASV